MGDNADGGLSVSTDLGVAACLSEHCSSCTLSCRERNSHPAAPTARGLPTCPSFLTHTPHEAGCLQSENVLGFAQTSSNVNIRGLWKVSLSVRVLLSRAFKVLTVLVLIVSQSQQLTFIRSLECVLFSFFLSIHLIEDECNGQIHNIRTLN